MVRLAVLRSLQMAIGMLMILPLLAGSIAQKLSMTPCQNWADVRSLRAISSGGGSWIAWTSSSRQISILRRISANHAEGQVLAAVAAPALLDQRVFRMAAWTF